MLELEKDIIFRAHLTHNWFPCALLCYCRSECGAISGWKHSRLRKGFKLKNDCMRKLGGRDGQYISHNVCPLVLTW